MFSFVARRSLALTSRGYHIARSMTVAVNVRPPRISKCVLARHVKPVSTSCFRFAADSGVTSGKKFVQSTFRIIFILNISDVVWRPGNDN